MTDTKRLFVRYFFWLLSASIMVLIFLFSAEDAAASSSTSSGFITQFLSYFSPSFRDATEDAKLVIIEQMQHIFRKAAHFSIYASLGFSLFSAVYTYRISILKKFIISMFIALLYASADEIHQTFIPGRAGMAIDVVLDFCGALFGALFVWLFILLCKSIKHRSKNMRKKELMNRLSELVLTVEELNRKVRDLNEENKELKLKLEEATNSVKEEIASVENKVEIENSSEVFKNEGFTVKLVEEIDFDAPRDNAIPEAPAKPEPILDDDALEYGAGVIGKITVESAKFCDKISEKGGSNARELLGLIMGKSEVCKNDILSIALSESTAEIKREMIDAQFNEALDFFRSIEQQNI